MKPSGLSSRLLVLIAAFATSFEAVAIAPASLLPAVAGFSRAGLRYEEARGSIWRGVLTGVEGGGYRLGDVEFELAPLSLLAGGAAVGLRMSGGAIEGDGKLRLSAFGGGEIRNARFLFDLGAAERYSFFGQRLEGLARADIVRRRGFTPPRSPRRRGGSAEILSISPAPVAARRAIWWSHSAARMKRARSH
jgi:hypothetical protein